MPLSIGDVNYSYPIAPTIGSKDISVSETINLEMGGNKKIGAIRKAYEKLFTIYDEKADNLLEKVKEILGKNITSDELKDIADIFDNDDIISSAFDGNNYNECKEGLKAYKFYLKEVITKLCNLYNIIDEAKSVIFDLNSVSENNEGILNNKAHVFITQLQCYDKQAQDIIKAFAEYSIIKNLTVTKYITYNNGSDHIGEQTDYRTYECIESAYRDLDNIIDRTKGRNSIGEYKDQAWLDSDIGKAWLTTTEGKKWRNETLHGIATEKQTVSRFYSTVYYKADEDVLADKYDLLAQVKIGSRDTTTEVTTSNMVLFDELTLLEKLQYVRTYYKDNSASRYVYPADNKIGYPCIQPPESTDALNDTKELGQVEMFYLGYIMDRDGPINALASFLEIKTSAIKSQIKVLMERIKAIKAYSNLLQKGFEEFSSAATYYNNIPPAAFYIYRYISTSATRCFYYINNEPYIIVQYSNAAKGDFSKDSGSGKEVDKPDGNFHTSSSGYYIVVKADEDGIKNFVDFLNNANMKIPCYPGVDLQSRALDILFTKLYTDDPTNNDNNNNYLTSGGWYYPFLRSVTNESFEYSLAVDLPVKIELGSDWGDAIQKTTGNYRYWHIDKVSFEIDTVSFEIPEKYRNDDKLKFEEISKQNLPKELDVPKLSGTNITEVYWKDGMAWNDLTPDSTDESLRKQELSSFISVWKGNFETVIANYKTNLEQQEKEISALQKKIQTFDTTSTNFRNKAFTVYNKIVNKIK